MEKFKQETYLDLEEGAMNVKAFKDVLRTLRKRFPNDAEFGAAVAKLIK